MKQRRARSPFVVTIALAAATGACGGSTSNEGSGGEAGSSAGGSGGIGGVGGSGGVVTGGVGGLGGLGGVGGYDGCGANPPFIPCPETPPEPGGACPVPSDPCFSSWWGTTCSYPDPCDGNEMVDYDCGGSSWQIVSGSACGVCPEQPPAKGSPCYIQANVECTYADSCPASLAWPTATCQSGTWEVVEKPCSADAGAP